MFREVVNRYHGGSQFRLQGSMLRMEIKKEVRTMQWELVVALVIAIPIILFPAAYVWYLNIGGIVAVIEKRKKSAAARWLFEFERKGIIAWERQDDKIKQHYLDQADSIVEYIKKG
ncbi:hypothetical protein ACFLXD_05485 [Chloroflexota bacterium]